MVKKVYRVLIIPYIILLLYFMLLGAGRTPMDSHIIRISPLISTWKFIENQILWNNWASIPINLLGNIILFIPFGFLGWIHSPFYDLKKLIFSFLSVLICVEFMQYITRMGVFDIDDILLNSLGVWIGFEGKHWLNRRVLKYF